MVTFAMVITLIDGHAITIDISYNKTPVMSRGYQTAKYALGGRRIYYFGMVTVDLEKSIVKIAIREFNTAGRLDPDITVSGRTVLISGIPCP